MPYATQADLETRFGSEVIAQRSDRINGSVIDAAVVSKALADADAEIDSYLAVRYQLPLAATPAVLVRVASDVALYRLYAPDPAPEHVRTGYEDAVRDLKRCADGTLIIDGAAPLQKSTVAGGIEHRAPSRVFDSSGLSGY